MICRSCSTKNNEYHRFCYQCGAELPRLNMVDNQTEHDQSANTKEEPLTSFPTVGTPVDMHPINSTEEDSILDDSVLDDSILDDLIPVDPAEGASEIVSGEITSIKTDALADNTTSDIVGKWSVSAMKDAANERSDSLTEDIADKWSVSSMEETIDRRSGGSIEDMANGWSDSPVESIADKWSVSSMEDAADDRSDSIIKEVSDDQPDVSMSKTMDENTAKPSDSTMNSWPKSSFDETEEAWSKLFMNNMSESQGEEEFNLQSQLPLRRYRKPEREESGISKVIQAFVYLIAFALVGVLVYIGYGILKQLPPREQPTVKQIDFEYTVDETEVDGNSARKILVKTSIGEQVKLLDKAAPVIRGNAEFILPDKDFVLAGIYDEIDGALQVPLTIITIADGYPDRTEQIHIQVPIQGAPLELISPSTLESIIDGESIQLILNVLPNSDIRINDNSYTHLLDSQGQLSVQLEVPDQEETTFEIRVAALGYEETAETLILKKRQMEFPLVVDQPVPIQALTPDEWVEITGNTHPEATLSANLVLREEAIPDPVTGDFTLYVKATARGLTPFVLTARLEGNEDSYLDMIIERPVNEGEYTRSAWAPSYQEFKSYPNLHHGTSYVFAGTVKEIFSTGTKTALLVNVAPQGQNEQLIYVEYWRTGRFTLDQKVRIFGNYWGSKDDNPYVLAYFIYQ